jgi:hypothetical protein
MNPTKMEFLSNNRWYFCQDKIPYFRYRILAILVGLCIIAACVAILPFVTILIDPFNMTKGKCTIEQKLMENIYCYLSGMITIALTIMSIMIIGFVMSGLLEYISLLKNKGLKDHCMDTISCGPIDPPSVHISVWGIYIIIISGFILLFLFPYYLTVPIMGKFTPGYYIFTMLIMILSGLVLAIIIIIIVSSCIKWNHFLASHRERSNKPTADSTMSNVTTYGTYGTISTPTISTNLHETV